jgi:uncharacterized membrane protein
VLNLNRHKSHFHIEQIGYFRFYTGIGVGVLFSLILDQFFLNLIKMSDVLVAMNNGYYNTPLNEKPDFYYSYFWSLFSISLGFSLTSYLWTSKPVLTNKRETRINRLAHANSLFLFGFVFFSISRLLQFYIEFHYIDYEIKSEVGILLFMVPFFIFSYCWNFISRIYRATETFFLSLLLFIVYGLILTGIKM